MQPGNEALPGTTGEHVTTRISFMGRMGNWEGYEISLRLGASEAEQAAAIDQARRQRDALMSAFHFAGLAYNPAEMIVSFGKHVNKTLGQAIREDRKYFVWYLSQPNIESAWRSAITEVMAEIDGAVMKLGEESASFSLSDMPM